MLHSPTPPAWGHTGTPWERDWGGSDHLSLSLTHLLGSHQIDGQHLVESRHSGRVDLLESINIIFCCGLARPTLCLVNLTFPTVTSNNANFTTSLDQINNFIISHLAWLRSWSGQDYLLFCSTINYINCSTELLFISAEVLRGSKSQMKITLVWIECWAIEPSLRSLLCCIMLRNVILIIVK